MHILVVGAGIGGLTAALALRRAGFDVHVYEQSSALREVGAGIAVSPNAVRVLHRLGLADALQAAGVAGFVHVFSNLVETLTEWQNKLGVSA